MITNEERNRMYRETRRNDESAPTYTAKWLDTGEVIYTNEPHGNLFGALPLGSWPESWGAEGDEWNGAIFDVRGSGRKVVVTRA